MLWADGGTGECSRRVRETVQSGSIGLFLDASVAEKHRATFAPASALCEIVWSVDVEPRDQDDEVLIKRCGRERYVFVTEDKRQRLDELITTAIGEAHIGFIEVRFKRAKFETKDTVYRQHLGSLCELVRHPRPFCAVLTNQGFRFVQFDAHLMGRNQHSGRQAAPRSE